MERGVASGVGRFFLATLASGGVAMALLSCDPGESDDSLTDGIPDDVAGWIASDEVSVYDPESIFDYIDGHAEVYLAYGMKRCLARRYSGPDGEADIVLDLFELASPADAYGVFTHDLDGDTVGIGTASLMRYGWLSFWQGPYFVSIVAEGESERSTKAVLELGRATAVLLPTEGAVPAIVAALPAAGLDPRSVRFLRHPQILNTHVWVDEENLFQLGPESAAALGTYARQEGTGHLLLVEYPSVEIAESAATAFADRFLGGGAADGPAPVEDGGWYGMRRAGEGLAAVLAADSEIAVDALLVDALASLEGKAP
ncbi:MAG: hypothetical protein OEM62_10805 [Acidobacteriota bacterium]|nr:hypothetical protein [Acidobacteriota bacterium]